MKVLLATNNQGKVERFKKLVRLAGLDVELVTPHELGIEALDVEKNGKTLAENALLKAKAYSRTVSIPVLANDTGFFVEGEGFVDAPKRIALGGAAEQSLSKEEINEKILDFWRAIATKYGGRVDAAWVEAFVVSFPDGKSKTSDSRREVVLTDKEFGTPPAQMPIRALYYSKTTGKPAVQHTEAEEELEMQPVVDALKKVLG